MVPVAIWSNFSAQSPAIKPAAPKINDDKIKNKTKIEKFFISIGKINEKTVIDIMQIIIDLVIDAAIIEKVTSQEDKGAPIKSTIFDMWKN